MVSEVEPLSGGKLAVPPAVGGDLKTIFDEGNQPADHNNSEQRRGFIFQMAVPGHRHKDIGDEQ